MAKNICTVTLLEDKYEELIDALRACDNYFTFLGQGISEELAHELVKLALGRKTE